MSFSHFTQAEFLLQRRADAAAAEQVPVSMVALPGAKAPIARDRLEALQAAGHSQAAIVDRINTAHETQPRVAARLAEHRGWVTGPYDLAVQVEAELKAQKEAESMRRRAEIEAAILKAREGDPAV